MSFFVTALVCPKEYKGYSPARLPEKLCVFEIKKDCTCYTVCQRNFPGLLKLETTTRVALNVSYFAYEKPSVAECFNSPLPHSRTTQLRTGRCHANCCFGTVKETIKTGFRQNGSLRLHAHVHSRVTVEEVELEYGKFLKLLCFNLMHSQFRGITGNVINKHCYLCRRTCDLWTDVIDFLAEDGTPRSPITLKTSSKLV